MLADRVRMGAAKDTGIFPPYLYHEGEEGISMVKGYSRGSFVYRKESSHIFLSTAAASSSNTNNVAVVTDIPINLDNVTSVEIEYERPLGASIDARLMVSTEKMGTHLTYDRRQNLLVTQQILALDVTELTGEYYIRVNLLSSYTGVQVKIYSIKLNYN